MTNEVRDQLFLGMQSFINNKRKMSYDLYKMKSISIWEFNHYHGSHTIASEYNCAKGTQVTSPNHLMNAINDKYFKHNKSLVAASVV